MSSGTFDEWDPWTPGTKVFANNSVIYIRPKKELPVKAQRFFDEEFLKGIKWKASSYRVNRWKYAYASLIHDGVIPHQCRTAMRGRALPEDSLGPAVRASIIRGVRCHHAFATSEEVDERVKAGDWHELTQARNARMIMSNIIPGREEMGAASSQPYCIWYPDFATGDTYRRLARQYPTMVYQAGRACAATGYESTYNELCRDHGMLPDVSMAEEARESGTSGGRAIYERIMKASSKYRIMKASSKYRIMDDFNCSISIGDLSPALLNGDTVVRWRLEERLEVCGPESNDIDGDIEGDNRIGLKHTPLPRFRMDMSQAEVKLLYMPLPQDIPTMKKDVLRKMAAYEGSVDRYARLAYTSHWTIDKIEYLCIRRGILHNTMFARWWLIVLDEKPPGYREAFQPAAHFYRQTPKLARIWRLIDSSTDNGVSSFAIRSAINARRIMINDIHHLTPDTSVYELPYEIWYPLKPHQNTMRYLAKQCPQMVEQIAITCILCDYQRTYDQLEFTPHERHIIAANQSTNGHYLEDINKRIREQDIDTKHWKFKQPDYDWEEPVSYVEPDPEPTSLDVTGRISDDRLHDPSWEFSPPKYLDLGIIERHVWFSRDFLQLLHVGCERGEGEGRNWEWLKEAALSEEERAHICRGPYL